MSHEFVRLARIMQSTRPGACMAHLLAAKPPDEASRDEQGAHPPVWCRHPLLKSTIAADRLHGAAAIERQSLAPAAAVAPLPLPLTSMAPLQKG